MALLAWFLQNGHHKCKPAAAKVAKGVPQGLVLGLIRFVIFIISLGYNIVAAFPDDTQI